MATTYTEEQYNARYQTGYNAGYTNGVTDAIAEIKKNINTIFNNISTNTSSNTTKVSDLKTKLTRIKGKCSSNSTLVDLITRSETAINNNSFAITGEIYNAILQIINEMDSLGNNIVNTEHKHLILSLYVITGLLSYTDSTIKITEIYNTIKTKL